jgi:hypothetical protein
MRVFAYFTMGALFAAAVWGQAVVEYSLGAAGSSGAAASAAGASKSIGSVFRSLSETIDKAGNVEKAGTVEKTGAVEKTGSAEKTGNKPAAVAGTPVSSQPKPPTRPAAGSKPFRPSEISEGLGRDELIERFGEPLMSITETNNSPLVERMWYGTTASDQIEIKLIGDKVVSVRPPPGKKQEAKN